MASGYQGAHAEGYDTVASGARIIIAEGEFQASKKMAAAAEFYEGKTAALRLRELQTLTEIAREKNLIIVPGGEMGSVAGIAKAVNKKVEK